MRPVSKPQSALRHPLNEVLGTETNVRLLRVLTLSDVPVAVSELAVSASLQASGVARACARFEDIGILETVGRGRSRQYRLSSRSALRTRITDLFVAERARSEEILRVIKSALAGGPDALRAAWIEGSVARGDDRSGDSIVVVALVAPADVDPTRVILWGRLLDVQRQFDVAVDLRMTTEADLKAGGDERVAALQDIILLAGVPPRHLLEEHAPPARHIHEHGVHYHAGLDRTAKRIAASIAGRLRTDPSIVARTRRHIEGRLPVASPGERHALQEWLDLLSTMSIARLRRFLVQDDSRATRLRQSLPFVDVISEAERAEILRGEDGTR